MSSNTLGSWYPVLLIAAYNTADMLGKAAPGSMPSFVVLEARSLLVTSAARIGFVPAFWLCVSGPPAMRGEVVVFILTIALGGTNGYVSSSSFVSAPLCVESHEAETAGILMVAFLLSGLTVGALCGWLWVL